MLFPVQGYDALPRATDMADLVVGRGERVLRYPDAPVPAMGVASIAAGTSRLLKWPTIPRIHPEVARFDDVVGFGKRLFVDYARQSVPIGCYRKPHFAPEMQEVPERPSDPRIIRGTTYSIDTAHSGYGHLLIEALSQLWAAEGVAPDRVLVNRRASPGFREMLSAFPFALLSTPREPVLYERLILASPSYVLDAQIDARYLALCDRIRRHFTADARPGARIYVSRRGVGKRVLVNEADIEALFARAGFTVLRPEALSIGEQVRAFASAAVVAGPVGSALYNIAFSRPGTRRIILAPGNFHTRNDMLLSAATGIPPIYAFGESSVRGRQEAMSANWRLPLDHAQAALDELETAIARG